MIKWEGGAYVGEYGNTMCEKLAYMYERMSVVSLYVTVPRRHVCSDTVGVPLCACQCLTDLSLTIQSGCRVYQFCYIVDGVAFSGVKHARSGDVIRLCCRTFLPVGTVCKSEPNGANDVAVCLGTLNAVLPHSRTLCYCILDLTIRTTQQDTKWFSERNS